VRRIGDGFREGFPKYERLNMVEFELKPYRKQQNTSDEELFKNLEEVWTKLGRQPQYRELRKPLSRYSPKPYNNRFGTFNRALTEFVNLKNNKNPVVINQPIENATQHVEDISKREIKQNIPTKPISQNSNKKPLQIYGEPIDFRGLRHAPLNEQGVVFIFGKVCKELGFQIEAIQTGFPDCKGKYLYDAKKNQWADALIEFEFKAANFKDHGHDPTQCNFIVCWENDWYDCPITVIELKTEILKLAVR